MKWSSSLQAIMSLIKPFACYFLAFSICLHLFLLDIADARTLPSDSSSCHNPPLQVCVSKHLHNELVQQGAASNFRGHKPLSRQPSIQVLHKAVGDSSRGVIKNAHIQNTTRGGRAMMGRLGSTPPSCVMRCAGCVPCNPVHVPIPRGRKRIGLLEYYPEAWRCKCKNKLYMPGLSTVP